MTSVLLGVRAEMLGLYVMVICLTGQPRGVRAESGECPGAGGTRAGLRLGVHVALCIAGRCPRFQHQRWKNY